LKHDDQKLTKGAEADEFRRLEREWQNQIGKDLLDVPWQQEGAREVFERQFERIAECLDLNSAGLMVEIGCGKGHLLEFLQGRRGPDGPMLVGIDVSEAAVGAREKGLLALRADGEFLPLPDESVSAFVYDGALHHLNRLRGRSARRLSCAQTWRLVRSFRTSVFPFQSPGPSYS
jgi:SAM-dependent methyltransferase